MIKIVWKAPMLGRLTHTLRMLNLHTAERDCMPLSATERH
jgi:hypothetical protein